jgi:ATP-dependent helicase/nuclease subunit A
MLLARKRESLYLVADALRTRAVPHGPVSEATLMDAAGAQDLVALLDLLASPQHGLSLARVLKSPLMGASDADLVALAVANPEPAGWWDALQSLIEPSPALTRARTLLRGWAAAAGELPPHDLLGRIVHESDLHARTAAALPPGERQAGLDAIDAVLAQALLDSGRYSTPYAFVRALRQRTVKAALPVPLGAVRLLTVHGAKGLEADTVLLLDADPEKPGNELCSLLIDWPVEAAAPLRCAFVYNESQVPPSLQETYAREEAARRRESLNVLYVAMTRARRRLAFSATEAYASGSGTTWWQRLEQAVPDELPPPEARTMAVGDALAPLPPAELRRLPSWRPARVGPTRESSSRTTVVAEEARAAALGRAVHRTLEWAVGAAGVASLGALSIAAAREFDADASAVRRHAAAVLAHADAARFFRGPQIRWSGNEVPVSESGEVLRIDRLVQLAEKGGALVWWVLDYKLHHAPEALEPYRQQLLRYRDVVRTLQPGERVRCAFIAGDGRVVEIE